MDLQRVNWEKNQRAGEKWLKTFKKHNLSYRKPENLSSVRKLAWTSSARKKIMANLEATYTIRGFLAKPNRVVVVDETSCHEVQNSPKILVKSGTRRVEVGHGSEGGKLVSVTTDLCPDCNMHYRYQEFTDGIINTSNSLFLSVNLCTTICSGLQRHQPVIHTVNNHRCQLAMSLDTV